MCSMVSISGCILIRGVSICYFLAWEPSLHPLTMLKCSKIIKSRLFLLQRNNAGLHCDTEATA